MRGLIDNINNALEFTGIMKIPFYRSSKESYKTLYKATAWFPITGMILGYFFYLINEYINIGFEYKAFSFVLLYSILTRATHIDGFVDCADAFFGGFNKERRLEILKDSAIGVFAGCALFFLLGAKFLLYKDLLNADLFLYIPLSFILSRNVFIFVALRSNYPREKGTGKIFVEKIGVKEFITSILICSFNIFLFFRENYILLSIIYLTSVLFAFIFRAYCNRKIGGITGDCLGAFIEISEVFYCATILYYLK